MIFANFLINLFKASDTSRLFFIEHQQFFLFCLFFFSLFTSQSNHDKRKKSPLLFAEVKWEEKNPNYWLVRRLLNFFPLNLPVSRPTNNGIVCISELWSLHSFSDRIMSVYQSLFSNQFLLFKIDHVFFHNFDWMRNLFVHFNSHLELRRFFIY